MFSFKTTSTIGGALAAALAVCWTFAPSLFYWMWQLQPSPTADLIGQRNAALFGAFALVLYLVRHHPPNPTRAALAGGFAVGCTWLALLGILAFLRGEAGPGIGLAVMVEVLLAFGFARFAR